MTLEFIFDVRHKKKVREHDEDTDEHIGGGASSV